MTHGAKALEVLLRQGLTRDHPIGVLLHQRRTAYVTDLGGAEALSQMETGLAERLAKLDLFEALLDARLIDPTTGKTRRLSWARLHSLGLLRVRLGDSYARLAGVLGLKRREKPTEDIVETARRLAAEQAKQWAAEDGNGDGDEA
jgi:hypothetical protein